MTIIPQNEPKSTHPELQLFVDGSDTGIPSHEVTVTEAPIVSKDKTLDSKPPILPEERSHDSFSDVFSLVEGPVTIQWPASMSKNSYEDLADWLDILKRKIGRSVKPGNDPALGRE